MIFDVFMRTSFFCDDKTAAVGRPFITSDEKFGPDKIAKLLLGKNSNKISLISLLLFFSTPLQQIMKVDRRFLVLFLRIFRFSLTYCDGIDRKIYSQS